MSRHDGWVTRASGELVETKKLVDQLRRHRGRLTRWELTKAIGWNPENRHEFNTVSRLCREWEVTTRDHGRVSPMPQCRPKVNIVHEKRLAREGLEREIRLAQIEAPHTPLYRVNDDW